MRNGDIAVHRELSIKMNILEVSNNNIKCSWYDGAYYIKIFNKNELITIDDYKLLLIQNQRDESIEKLVS